MAQIILEPNCASLAVGITEVGSRKGTESGLTGTPRFDHCLDQVAKGCKNCQAVSTATQFSKNTNADGQKWKKCNKAIFRSQIN